jgi:LuxR family transcriptional regulator, maltose regulon positive regulatory protein
LSELRCTEPDIAPHGFPYRAPAPPFDAVARAGVVAALDRNVDKPIVVVAAPPGYGKTTAIAQWVERDGRPCCWISITPDDDEPAVLLGHVVAALSTVGVVRPGRPWASTPTEALPRLSVALERAPEPFVLVLDGVDHLRRAGAQTVLRVLARHVPDGVQLVLIARGPRALSIGTLAMQRRLHRIGTDALAMSAPEVRDLFAERGVLLEDDEFARLAAETEGWPAVLDIAARKFGIATDPRRAAGGDVGANPEISQYVEEVVLAPLSEPERDVCRVAAVVGSISGRICDAVVGADGSGEIIVELSRRTELFRPEDRVGTTYRLHPVVGAVLRQSLAERPRELGRIHRRASRAYEDEGDLGQVVEHAQAAGDGPRAAVFVWRAVASRLASREAARFDRWMSFWSDDEIAADPALCCARAWCELVVGEPADAGRWIKAAGRAPEDVILSDGTPLRAALALLRAVMGRQGLTRARDDARLAVELAPRDAPLVPIAYAVGGCAERLLGDPVAARRLLDEGAELASVLAPTVQAQALTQLALIAVDEQRFDDADTLCAGARRIVEAEDATERPTLALVFALAASFAARRGATDEAQLQADRCVRAVRHLDGVLPAFGVEARVLVSSAYAQLGDYRTARTMLHEAEHLLTLLPDSGSLPERLAAVREQVGADHVPVGLVAARLTPAEMRVLRMLPTHLSFPEVADALFVSRHTVKTHAVAVYHKLGVSSRTDAVRRARELGLLE